MAEWILFLCLFIAVITDFRSWKIPNVLILTGTAIGSVCRWQSGGAEALIQGYVRMGILIVIFFFLFQMHALGAGDIKLLAMAGLFLENEDCLYAILWTFLVGSLFSIGKLIKERNAKERFQYFFQYINHCIITQKTERYRGKKVDKTCTIHMSLVILVGHVFYLEVIR